MAGHLLKKSEKGTAMVIMLIALTVLSIMSVTFVRVVLMENKSTKINQDKIQAYYVAHSGADAVAQYMIDNPTSTQTTYMINGPTSLPASVPSLPNSSFQVKVTQSDAYTILINSTGKYGSASSNAQLSLSCTSSGWQVPQFDTAVFAFGTISLSGSANFIGSAGTNSTSAGAVSIDNSGSQIAGNLYVGTGGDTSVVNRPSKVTGSITSLVQPRTFSLPVFPDYPTNLPSRGNLNVTSNLTVSADGYYPTITVGSGAVLNFDVGSGVRNIKVDTLNVGYQGITVTGSGSLCLYVTTNMSFSSGTSVNPANPDPHPEKIIIYYSGTNPVSVSSGTVVATLYAKQASNITLSNGNSFIGNIISGGPLVTLSGGTSSYVHAILAPNAAVNMSGGAALTGAIISNSFTAIGSSRVTNNSNISFPAALINGGTATSSSTFSIGEWH